MCLATVPAQTDALDSHRPNPVLDKCYTSLVMVVSLLRNRHWSVTGWFAYQAVEFFTCTGGSHAFGYLKGPRDRCLHNPRALPHTHNDMCVASGTSAGVRVRGTPNSLGRYEKV